MRTVVRLSVRTDVDREGTVGSGTRREALRGQARHAWIWLLGAVAIMWLLPLGHVALISPDEGRYATLALHMLQSGDWVTPRLNGFLYFEKPPLGYWAGALALWAFGSNEFAARLWPALSGLGSVAAVGWVASRWWDEQAALRAVAMAGSMAWLVANSHFLTLDSSLNLGLSLVLAGLLAGFAPASSSSHRRAALCIAWVGMAVAVLSKGPVGIVIPAGALVIYSAVEHARGRGAAWRELWGRLEWRLGGLLFAALTLPWFVAVSLRNPGFADFFFIHEHLLRYTTTLHHRGGPWFYFVPVLLVGALPWTTLLLQRAWQDMARRGAGRTTGGASPLQPSTLLWCWCAFIFVFFSLSSSKLPSYILPMFPALALLAARPRATDERGLRWHLLVPLLLWASVPALWPLLPHFAREDAPVDAIRQIFVYGSVGAVVVAVGCAVAWWLAGRGRDNAAIVVVAAAHLGAALLLGAGYGRYAELKSARSYAPLIAAALPAHAPVFELRRHDQTLPFYLKRNVQLVDFVDEFAYGESVEPGRIVPSLEDFKARWQALPAAAAVMSPEIHRQLASEDLPMRLLFRDARRVVVERPAP